jgi:hypothetical protein
MIFDTYAPSFKGGSLRASDDQASIQISGICHQTRDKIEKVLKI